MSERRVGLLVGAAALGALVACLSGCAAPPPESVATSNPYASEFARVLARTESDYARGVLADGKITAAEFDETLDLYIGCLKDGGVEAFVEELASGAKQVVLPAAQEDSPAVADCEERWNGGMDGIVALYSRVLENPPNVSLEELQAACMVQEGLAPKGFTGQELDQMMSDAAEQTTVDMDGAIVSSRAPINPTPTLPGGVPLFDERTQDCFDRPWETMQRHTP